MKYTSTKSQGYKPKMSGSNTMYYTGGSGSLLGMMQDGGASPAALARFRRAKQYNKDMERLKALAAQEARKREKASKWGKIGRTLGGFIPGLGGVIGRTVGDYIGTSKGYGGELDVDTTGTVYGQKGFKALSDSSKEFLGDDKSFKLPGFGLLLGDIKYKSGIGEDVALRSGQELLEGAKFASNFIMPGAGAAIGATTKGFDPSVVKPTAVDSSSIMGDFYQPSTTIRDSFLNSPQSATVSTPLISNPSASGNIINNSYASDASAPYYDDDLPGQYIFNREDGGLMGYQTGGYTPSSVLAGIGLDPTDVQLEQFEAYDPTAINQFQSGLQENLLSGTKQAETVRAKAGFAGSGVVQQAQADQRMNLSRDYAEAQQKALKDYASGIVDQATKMEAAGNTFKELKDNPIPPFDPTSDPNWNPPDNPSGGSMYEFNGNTYFWNADSSSWITEREYNDMMDDYYEDAADFQD
tara:strand:- start:869 stop:2272 length:1404 start_codon:yes stop_codon:yes gene_type:complete